MFTRFHLYIILPFLLVLGIIFIAHLTGSDFALLNPKGTISHQQKELALTAFLLMLTIVLPVFLTTFLIAHKYQEKNTKAKYDPDWKRSKMLVAMWWILPSIIVLILGVNNWNATHRLDPFRALASNNEPITIQVISLQWKWLFIYPEKDIATVNFLEFPEKTPLNFELTSDAPMNSFWIPSLGGQMYTMTGMGTKLHLMADTTGEFKGSAAEISGRGFSGMKFMAKSVTQKEFDVWVDEVKSFPKKLDTEEYNQLAIPSENTPPYFYSSTEQGLYNNIMMKYMGTMSH